MNNIHKMTFLGSSENKTVTASSPIVLTIFAPEWKDGEYTCSLEVKNTDCSGSFEYRLCKIEGKKITFQSPENAAFYPTYWEGFIYDNIIRGNYDVKCKLLGILGSFSLSQNGVFTLQLV